jgi:hypothetical protein
LLPILADLIILAIDTSQVTVTEEYRPRTPAAREDRLFSVVGTERSNYGLVSGMTEPKLTFKTIYTTRPGADIARNQPCFQLQSAVL